MQLALARISDIEFLLFGDEKEIAPHFAGEERVKIIHCSDVIDMGTGPDRRGEKGVGIPRSSGLFFFFFRGSPRQRKLPASSPPGPRRALSRRSSCHQENQGHETGHDLSDASGTGRKKAAPARCRREHGTLRAVSCSLRNSPRFTRAKSWEWKTPWSGPLNIGTEAGKGEGTGKQNPARLSENDPMSILRKRGREKSFTTIATFFSPTASPVQQDLSEPAKASPGQLAYS